MRAEGKQVLINNITKFESEKPFGLVIGGNKRNTQPIGKTDFTALTQEREKTNQNSQ